MNRHEKNRFEGPNTDVLWGEIAPSDHVLQIYKSDNDFIDTLEGFVTSGFHANESVIIVATPQHLVALNERLRRQQWDLFSLTLQDQYIPLSAEDALGEFLIDGWPDENLFGHLVANLLLRARKHGRHVRAFGEMVALLWSRGYFEATAHLEKLWTRFCESEKFSLFCAYPSHIFAGDSNESLTQICKCHSKMVSSDGRGHRELVPTEGSYRLATG